MFDTICTLPLDGDLFAQAVHPTVPLVAVGLDTGHVQCFRIPSLDAPAANDEDDDTSSPALSGYGEIETAWRTWRHKISCRAVGFSLDGAALYSAGADGIVKVADTATGQVTGKAIVQTTKKGKSDPATVLHALSPQTLLLATDAGAMHLYDLRSSDRAFAQTLPSATFRPHDEYVSSITPLPPSEASTSGFSKQWISTGGTTLAVTDLRKGVVSQSADQEEELLSSVFVDGLSKKKGSGSKAVVGDGSGTLTIWERGLWDDQEQRIVLDRGIDSRSGDNSNNGESVECLARIPHEVAGVHGTMVAAGMGGGLIACVQLGQNSIVDVLRHDEVESVQAIGFDVHNRMISGGGQVVKVWSEHMEAESDAEMEDAEEEAQADVTGDGKADSDSDDDSDEDSDSDGGKSRRRKKKRKGKSGSAASKGVNMGSYKGLD